MAVTITSNLTNVSGAESLSDGGTWTASGSASAAAADGDIFIAGSNSLNGKLDGGGGNDATGGLALVVGAVLVIGSVATDPVYRIVGVDTVNNRFRVV